MKLTAEQYADLIKARPHLAPVDTVESPKPKPDTRPTLDGASATQESGASSLEKGSVRVSLVAFRRRLQDSDNSTGSMKPLRDSIAAHLGLDDADDCIAWEYGQQLTRGAEGVAVKIELV